MPQREQSHDVRSAREHPGSLHLAPEVSERVGSILRAAEAEAERLRQDAAEAARRQVEEARLESEELVAERRRRLADLSDELTRKAESIVSRIDDAATAHGFRDLAEALAATAARLAAEYGGSTADPAPAPLPAAERPPATPGPAAGPGSGSRPGTDHDSAAGQPPRPFGATPQPAGTAPGPPSGRRVGRQQGASELDVGRFVGVQLAAAGSTRGEVRRHLAGAMPDGECEEILDEVYGAGSGDRARVPWVAWEAGDDAG